MKPLRPVILLAHLFFLAMLCFAIVFFVERFTYIDNSFYAFKIITFKTFNIELNRYSAFITQILPLLAIKLNLSLKYVLISYSISFVLIYYAIFLINVYLFKSAKAGIATTLVMILGLSDGAFYPVTEIEFGVVLCILFYGYLEFYFQNINSLQKNKLTVIQCMGALIILLCLLIHPATLIPVLFILFFEIINYRLYSNKTPWVLLLFILVVYLIKLLTIPANGYEGNKIEPLRNFFSLARHFRGLYSLKFFYLYTKHGIYALPLVLMFVTGIYYLIKKNYQKLIYYGIATGGCFVLLVVAHSPGESDIGMEKNFLPFWIFAAVPFVHDFLLNKAILAYARTILYVAIIICASIFFYRAALIHITRTDYIRQILKTASDKTGGNKFVIEQKSLDMNLIGNHWSFANDALLLSSLDGKDKSKGIYLVDDINKLRTEFDFNAKDAYLSVSFWLLWGHASMNHNYFNFPLEPYVFIEDKIPYVSKSKPV